MTRRKRLRHELGANHLSLSMAEICKERDAVARIVRLLRRKSPRKRRSILELASVMADEGIDA